MSTPNTLVSSAQTIYTAFRSHVWLWIIPTFVLTATAVGYALVRTSAWEAAQAIVVRDEAIGNLNPQGRFNNAEIMRSFQETILEVARSRAAVVGALTAMSPPQNRRSTEPWPSDDEVRQMQEQIKLSAPKGAEFGSTEVIYISVQGPTRHEAIARTQAICDQLETRLAELRNAKAEGVIAELEETLNLALKELEAATSHLETMEREVGSDLGELRVLNDSGVGVGNLRTMLNEVTAETRQVKTTHEANQHLRDLLASAQSDPDQLLATPAALLTSQPTLARLRDGLVDAQLRTSELRGSMNEDHPLIQSAIRAEEEVRQNIVGELSTALRGIESDIRVGQHQIDSLDRQQAGFQLRLDRLASLRARYGNLVDDVRQRTEIVNQGKQNLADATASQRAAMSTSLLTRFETPETGDTPLGPGRFKIVVGGLFGGLIAGAGLVFLTLPGNQPRGRRWSDILHFGRRASDQSAPADPPQRTLLAGRRTCDPPTDDACEDSPREAGAVAPDRRRRTDRRADDPE